MIKNIDVSIKKGLVSSYLVINYLDFIGLKGQNISAQGNALGIESKIKTVREVTRIKAEKIFRTELFIEKYKETRVCSFRPKLQVSFKKLFCADYYNMTNSSLGYCYYIFPFQGKEKFELNQSMKNQ